MKNFALMLLAFFLLRIVSEGIAAVLDVNVYLVMYYALLVVIAFQWPYVDNEGRP